MILLLKLVWGQVVEAAVWSYRVVVASTGFSDHLRFPA
jgi:hypothetical protein